MKNFTNGIVLALSVVPIVDSFFTKKSIIKHNKIEDD